jgi:hypothetical protein
VSDNTFVRAWLLAAMTSIVVFFAVTALGPDTGRDLGRAREEK